eukprot:462362_1
MQYGKNMWLMLPFLLCVNAYLPQIEINGLTDIYDSWNGDNWSVCKWNLNYLTNTSEDHILSDNYCGLLIAFHDSNDSNLQYIYGIEFWDNNNIYGTIPMSIGNFESLMYFDISFNRLYGTIPHTICKLNQLIEVWFEWTNLNGSVPTCLSEIECLEAYYFRNNSYLSLNATHIELLCKYSTNLVWLGLYSVNYIGHIPNCIGIDLLRLQYLYFEGLYTLNGTLPISINNLTNLTRLGLYDLHGLDTTNKLLLNVTNFDKLWYLFIDLTNIILVPNVSSICNIPSLKSIGFQKRDIENKNSIFIVPECIFTFNKYLGYLYLKGPQIYGNINHTNFCNIRYLNGFEFFNTKNLKIMLPECLNKFNVLADITIRNNSNLYGILPTFNSTYITNVQIQYNPKLTGSISHMFADDNSFRNLQILTLDNNNFVDDNIEIFLENILKLSINLVAFTINDNKYISGSFPSINNHGNITHLNHLQVFAAHNLNLFGTLPSHLYLSNKVNLSRQSILFSIYGNRLSGSIPSHLYNSISTNIIKHKHNFIPIILIGNLFKIFDENKIQWLSKTSHFFEAINLYLKR